LAFGGMTERLDTSVAGCAMEAVYGICRKKREPTSGLEPLTCSLRVNCSYWPSNSLYTTLVLGPPMLDSTAVEYVASPRSLTEGLHSKVPRKVGEYFFRQLGLAARQILVLGVDRGTQFSQLRDKV
jgi:hypothetical protein